MNINDYDKFITYLYTLSDDAYLTFNKKIVNTPSKMIGIRAPLIKEISKNIYKNDPYCFLDKVRNNYYEEDLLEGLGISKIKEPILFDKYLERFIPKINNWAVCDMCISSMKQMKKDEKYFLLAKKYIHSDKEFIIRAGYIIIMDHFLDNKHIDEILNILNKEKESQYYYVNMAKAWLISVCYVKFKEKTLVFLLNNNLDTFTYNKAIQKIIESNRINISDKEYLKQLKRKIT